MFFMWYQKDKWYNLEGKKYFVIWSFLTHIQTHTPHLWLTNHRFIPFRLSLSTPIAIWKACAANGGYLVFFIVSFIIEYCQKKMACNGAYANAHPSKALTNSILSIFLMCYNCLRSFFFKRQKRMRTSVLRSVVYFSRFLVSCIRDDVHCLRKIIITSSSLLTPWRNSAHAQNYGCRPRNGKVCNVYLNKSMRTRVQCAGVTTILHERTQKLTCTKRFGGFVWMCNQNRSRKQ